MLADRTNQAGTPRTQSTFRLVEPSITVLIDLAALYGRQPDFRRPNILVLPSLSVMVMGQLGAWVLSDSGWFGACRYRIKLAHAEYLDQSHLVPAWTLRRATADDVRQATMRGELSGGSVPS